MPVAARMRPIRGSVVSRLFDIRKICWSSHELVCRASQAMLKIRPMSPTRLYKTAWRAAVFASARPYHQPIKRKDIMPTPSHPIKSWKRLLAVTRTIIATRKVSKYLKNRSIWGSACMYHEANSRIDQETNNAIGVNVIE